MLLRLKVRKLVFRIILLLVIKAWEKLYSHSNLIGSDFRVIYNIINVIAS